MRSVRYGMVQTEDQYLWLTRAVDEFGIRSKVRLLMSATDDELHLPQLIGKQYAGLFHAELAKFEEKRLAIVQARKAGKEESVSDRDACGAARVASFLQASGIAPV